MRMYLYYAWHSFLGVLKKLFRTWVAILIVACLVLGVLFGVVGGVVGSILDGSYTETRDYGETVEPAETVEDPELILDVDVPAPDSGFALAAGELAAGAIVLVVLGLNVFTGEKSGSHIFIMADVNLLFPSPRKPQSVLLFKLGTRLFTYLFLTLYMGFQVPNLLNMGMPPALVLALFPAWFFLLVFGQLLAVLIYTLTATHGKTRKFVRPAVYAVLGVTAAAFILYTRLTGTDLWTGACAFFNSPVSRFVPLWGWIKAIPFLVAEGNYLWLGVDLAALLLTTVLLVRYIWGLDADFYEDALSFAEDLDRATREAQENGRGIARIKKKERKTEARELSLSGMGAAVYFTKALQNRFRTATLRVFTKTGVTYLLIAAATGALGRFAVQSDSVLFLAIPLLIAVFIRSFGNPIIEDSNKPFFLMIPEKTAKKVFWSHLGGTANTLLDLVPAVILGTVLLGCDPLQALLWLIVLATVDFYAASVGVFGDFILPDSIPKQVKTGIQIMLIYFSVLPAGGCLAVSLALGEPLLLLLAGAVNCLIGAGLTAWSGGILDAGRK